LLVEVHENIAALCLLRTYQLKSVHGRDWDDHNICPHRYSHDNLDHQTDARAGVPQSEVVTIALVVARPIIIGLPLM
jgi:hypothetical protein